MAISDLVVVAACCLPVVMFVGIIVYFVRQTDRSKEQRGFDVELTGEQPVNATNEETR